MGWQCAVAEYGGMSDETISVQYNLSANSSDADSGTALATLLSQSVSEGVNTVVLGIGASSKTSELFGAGSRAANSAAAGGGTVSCA